MDQIIVPANLIVEMRAHVSRLAPEEACGLIGGVNRLAQVVVSVANQLHSPVRFRMDPAEQLDALEQIDQLGLTLLGIYHSHPDGPIFPSQTDIDEALDIHMIYLIWTRQDNQWCVHAYRILRQQFSETELLVLTD